jgi:hypothetical protein
MLKLSRPIALLLSIFCMHTVWAHEYGSDYFVMFHPFAYPSQAGQTLVPVYLRFIRLMGTDKLIGVECRYAGSAEFRANQDLQAPAIPYITVSPDQSFDIEDPNTPHILLKDIRLPFGFMRHYDMKLIFEKSGPIDLTVAVGM